MTPRWSIAVFLVAGAFAASAAEPPRRVVSMNLCTDQMALLLAAPGQVVSVSKLARDPAMSNMAEEAAVLPVNWGRAEEILALEPDLVVAGTYTTRATVDLLRRLGFRVETFAPETSFADMRAHVTRMGALLGREARAAEVIAALDADLAAIAAARPAEAERPLAVAYYAGGRTAGTGTLVDEAMRTAGLRNLAVERGIAGSGVLPLETLVAARPDVVIGSIPDRRGPALAHQNYRHPALAAATAPAGGMVAIDDRLTICGGPFTLDAVRDLAARARTPRPPEAAR